MGFISNQCELCGFTRSPLIEVCYVRYAWWLVFWDHGINYCITFLFMGFAFDWTQYTPISSVEPPPPRDKTPQTEKKKIIHTLHYYYHFENSTKFESSSLRRVWYAAYVPIWAYIYELWMTISIELSLWCAYVNICWTNKCARASTIAHRRRTQRRQPKQRPKKWKKRSNMCWAVESR